MGQCLIQAAQLGKSEQGEFSPTHAFKGWKTRAHTHGPGDSPLQTLTARRQMGITRDEEGQDVANRGRRYWGWRRTHLYRSRRVSGLALPAQKESAATIAALLWRMCHCFSWPCASAQIFWLKPDVCARRRVLSCSSRASFLFSFPTH